MTVADQRKILDRKIKQNETQYNLDRKSAKISALSSKNLAKYEHLTGEDLGYEKSALEQARFEYSPVSRFLNKSLKEEEEEEGRLKILENIEDKNKKQLKAIEVQGNKQLNAIKNINISSKQPKAIDSFSRIGPEVEKLMSELKEEQDFINFENLFFCGNQ